MKNGRPAWTIKCPPETLRRVEERVDGGGEYFGTIYRELNLVRFVRLSTFRHWCAVRRRDQNQRREQGGKGTREQGDGALIPRSLDPSIPVSVDDTITQCVAAISEALAAGRVGKLDVGKALRSLAELKQLSISEAANRRAEELHELKLVDLKSRLRTAVEKKSEGGSKSLTREDVYDLVDAIMRGEAA